MQGMTIAQHKREEFYTALEEYKLAIQSGDAKRFLVASVRVHAAKGGVTKREAAAVGRVFRQCKANPLTGPAIAVLPKE